MVGGGVSLVWVGGALRSSEGGLVVALLPVRVAMLLQLKSNRVAWNREDYVNDELRPDWVRTVLQAGRTS